MKHAISPQDIKSARIPHEVFLTNLIANHVLLFVAIMSASSLTHLVVVIPVLSMLSLLYIFLGAQRAKRHASCYVKAHWRIAVRRSRFFLLMLSLMFSVFGLIYWFSGGDMRPQHWAFGGAAFLPTMVSVLGLIIFESESLQQAKSGILPDWVGDCFSENTLEPIQE